MQNGEYYCDLKKAGFWMLHYEKIVYLIICDNIDR